MNPSYIWYIAEIPFFLHQVASLSKYIHIYILKTALVWRTKGCRADLRAVWEMVFGYFEGVLCPVA